MPRTFLIPMLVALTIFIGCTSPKPPPPEPAAIQAETESKTLCGFRGDILAFLVQMGLRPHLGLVTENKQIIEIWQDTGFDAWVMTIAPEPGIPVVCILGTGNGWFVPAPSQNVGEP